MYAVISLQGHQYIVQKGMSLEVDRIKGMGDIEKNSLTTFDVSDVLCLFDGDGNKVSVGKPFVSGVKVVCEFKENIKGKKIRVTKFKRKNRYTRIIGFRPKYTVLHIKDIIIDE